MEPPTRRAGTSPRCVLPGPRPPAPHPPPPPRISAPRPPAPPPPPARGTASSAAAPATSAPSRWTCLTRASRDSPRASPEAISSARTTASSAASRTCNSLGGAARGAAQHALAGRGIVHAQRERGVRLRAVDRVSLPEVDPHGAHPFERLRVLDAFGDGLRAERFAQALDRFDHGVIHAVAGDAADVGAVDLEVVDRQRLQVGERR